MAVSQTNERVSSKKVSGKVLHNVSMKLHKIESLLKEMKQTKADLIKIQRQEKRNRAKADKMNAGVAHLAKGSRSPGLSRPELTKIASNVRQILADLDKRRPKDQPYKDGVSTALLAILKVGGEMKRNDIAKVAQMVAPRRLKRARSAAVNKARKSGKKQPTGNAWGLTSCNWQLDRLIKASMVLKPDTYGKPFALLPAGSQELAQKLGKTG